MSGGLGAPLGRLMLPGRIEVDLVEYSQSLASSIEQPAQAIVEGSPSGLILAIENLIVHYRLHRLAPEPRGWGEVGLRRL